jgi:hypothetical protein
MSWIGVESAEEGPGRPRPKAKGQQQDWVLRVRLDGRLIESRLLRVTESDAHSYARRLSADYTLRPAS